MFPATAKAPEEQRTAAADGGARRLHVAEAHIPIPYVTPGDVAAGARAFTLSLPSPRKLALYGGLGVLAVAGALEWPVAVAVGAAVEVVTREKGEEPGVKREEGRPARA